MSKTGLFCIRWNFFIKMSLLKFDAFFDIISTWNFKKHISHELNEKIDFSWKTFKVTWGLCMILTSRKCYRRRRSVLKPYLGNCFIVNQSLTPLCPFIEHFVWESIILLRQIYWHPVVSVPLDAAHPSLQNAQLILQAWKYLDYRKKRLGAVHKLLRSRRQDFEDFYPPLPS